jgi:hypothetical protein
MATGIELAQAWVRLTPTMEGVQGEVSKALAPAEEEANASGQRSGEKFSTGMKLAIAAAGAAVIASVVKVFNTGLEEIKFGEQINAQTQVLLDNTDFSVPLSKINEYTLGLAGMAGISEEKLQEAGNEILKFGNVSEENYFKALNSINDMAAGGKEAGSVATALAKALADPAQAAGVLKRSGVILNEEQKALIDNFVAAGDVAGAQGVILDGLESTYGGMAEAMGGTLGGQMDKFNVQWENLAGSLVEHVAPALSGMMTGLQGLIGFLSENQEFIAAFAVVLGGVLAVAFYVWAASIWATTVALLANPVTWIILAVVALIAAIILLVANWDDVVKFLSDTWAGFVGWITGVMEGFAGWWGEVWANISGFFTSVWEGIVGFFTDLWNGLVSWYIGLLVSIAVFIFQTVMGIADFWVGVWEGIVGFFTDLWSGVVSFVSGVFTSIGDTILGALEWIGKTWNDMWQGMVDFLGKVFAGVVGVVKAPINGIIGLINGAIAAINSISITIPDWVPLVGGQTWGLSLPKIPYLAKGGTITASGLTMVGERGPELLNLPKGAQVNPDYDELPTGGVIFQNYAPLGQSPAQALTEFSNRAKGL